MADIIKLDDKRPELRTEAGRSRTSSKRSKKSRLSVREKIKQGLYTSIKVEPRGNPERGFKLWITYSGAGALPPTALVNLKALGEFHLPRLKKEAGEKPVHIQNWTGIPDEEFGLPPKPVAALSQPTIPTFADFVVRAVSDFVGYEVVITYVRTEHVKIIALKFPGEGALHLAKLKRESQGLRINLFNQTSQSNTYFGLPERKS